MKTFRLLLILFFILISRTSVYSNQQDYILYNIGLERYLKSDERTNIAPNPKFDYYIVDSVQIDLRESIEYIKKEIRKKSKRLSRRFENDTTIYYIDVKKLKIDGNKLYPCKFDFCGKLTSPTMSVIYISKIYYDSVDKYAAFILSDCKLNSGTKSLIIIKRLKHNRYSVKIKAIEYLSR